MHFYALSLHETGMDYADCQCTWSETYIVPPKGSSKTTDRSTCPDVVPSYK